MVRVRVLGELALEVDGNDVELPASRRARALLGLLAVERRAHPRSQLAARFWPDVLDESARTSLRSALSALRKAFGPAADRCLVADRDTVALAGPDVVATDLYDFEALLAAGRVDEALALSRGPLLDGLDDDWVNELRDEHRERMASALAGLAADAEADGDLAAATALTRRMVALDPLAEEPQRELIRRLGAAGDRPAALAAYRRLQDRLRTELAIAPSARTRELVASLREDAGPAAPAPARDHPTGTVTLLFTDQLSSTETLLRLGDDAAERVRRTHFRLLREVAGTHGGQEVKNLGDGLMVAFASAVDAVACAIGIQQGVHRHAGHEGEEALAVRVGLNVGEPIVDDGDYFGTPVVVAKRLCDAAGAGQILASDVVRALVGTRGGFAFRGVGTVPLKGIAEPVAACEVAWEPTTEQRIPLPPAVLGTETGAFVGRGEALAELEGHWAAVLDGERRVVLLGGEPGMGKTRLAAEFCAAAHERGATVLAGRCYEEMLIPYQPFVEALRRYVDGCPPAELAVQVAPRRRELATLVPDLDTGARTAPAGRPELDAEQERFRLFEAVAGLVGDAAAARPAILVLDDLHWADEGSLLLLRHVVRVTEGSALLILGTYRETELYRGSDLAAALAELRRARALHDLGLEGLPEPDVARLIAAQSGGTAPEAFASAVAERTDGNPFFIEELLRHVDDPEHAVLDELAVPDSVKDLLLRRLERLDEDARRTLAVAAVAGREFDLALLEEVLGVPADELVELLERPALVQVVADEPGTIGRYRFAHPLIRETIYGDLSVNRRALMHRRVGAAVESLFADRIGAHAGTLAHHYHAAGDAEKAFEYHRRAADEAERAVAHETALEQLTGAIAAGELLGLTAAEDAVMRDLYRRRAWSASSAGTPEAVERDYAIALEGARAAGDRELEMHALNGLGSYLHIRDSARSIRCHEQALAIADELRHRGGQVNALNRLSLVHANQLDLAEALALAERALALAREGDDERAVSRALDCLKFVALMLGDTVRLEELTATLSELLRRRRDYWFLQWSLLESAFTPTAGCRWDEAARRLDEALAMNRRMGDRISRGMILHARCWLERCRGDYARALSVGADAVRITSDGLGALWLGWTTAMLAASLADLRAWPETVEQLEASLDAAEGIGARAQLFGALGPLAWARLQAGDRAGAAAAAERWDAEEAEIRVPPGQAHLYQHGSYTDRARVALALGDVERAEAILNGIRGPLERFGIRNGLAPVYAGLAGCAEVRGEQAAAEELLERGLAAAGEDGLPAARLDLHIALARLGRSADPARKLIERIAQSIGDETLASGFRAAALRELGSPAGLAAEQR
jgi:DNA-binding SARP family transcriptional activator/tetratricopeptide (TPR) repeat protein